MNKCTAEYLMFINIKCCNIERYNIYKFMWYDKWLNFYFVDICRIGTNFYQHLLVTQTPNRRRTRFQSIFDSMTSPTLIGFDLREKSVVNIFELHPYAYLNVYYVRWYSSVH